ncbi:MAG: PDZ domain-containing protein [Clostridia bacterium]|nr:PDZ domain-containing protein [Clostridia bacterium]
MKKIRPILFVFLLIIIYIYVAYISLFPNNIIIFEGETISLNRIYGVEIKEVGNLDSNLLTNSKTMQAATNITENRASQIGKTNISLNLFNSIPLKQVEVNVIKRTKVVPLGNAIGLKLYTKGVMVVGMSEVQGEDKNNYRPYENTGLQEGDMIVEIDDVTVTCISELIDTVNKSKGDQMKVKFVRDSGTKITNITPIKTSSSEYKLGLWVRDARGAELVLQVFLSLKQECFVLWVME